MDKYEYKVRADEIRELIFQGQYAKAAELADTIDWSRVKKSAILCTISDLYKKNRRYDDAIELLQLAYERYPGGKEICYSLCELYIKTNNIIKAVATYKEFLQVGSNDPRRYILQYKIYEMQDVSLEERIEVLEELKSRDYREKWAYTLAYLYHRVGLATKCVEECDELILWFDEGKYVYMAMELKMRHQPLTPAQQEKYNRRFEVMGGEGAGNYAPAEDSGLAEANTATANTTDKVADNGEYSDNSSIKAEVNNVDLEGVVAPTLDSDVDKAALAGQTIVYNPIQGKNSETVMVPDGSTVVVSGAKGAVSSAEAIALSMGYTQVYHGMQPEPEIQVKQVDVGEYNTINLQQAIAEGVAEVLENNGDNGSSIESIIKADTKEIYPQGSELTKNQAEGSGEDVSSSLKAENLSYVPQSVSDKTVVIAKVSGTFDATKTIPFHDIQKAVNSMEAESAPSFADTSTISVPIENAKKPAAVDVVARANMSAQNKAEIESITMPTGNIGTSRVVYPENNQVYAENLSQEMAMSPAAVAAMSAQPPEPLAEVLTQEADGQLSLVMPEDKLKLVSQITGQLSINDVMAEWNRMKFEREELNRKKYHEKVKQQTGELFNEFERAALNGVLETLEKESEEAAKAREIAEREATQRAEEERAEMARTGLPVQKLSFEKVNMSSADEAINSEVAEDGIAVATVATDVVAEVAADTATVVAVNTVDSVADVVADTVTTVSDVAAVTTEVSSDLAKAATVEAATIVAEDVITPDDQVEELVEIDENVSYEDNYSSEAAEKSEEEAVIIPEKKELSFEENIGSIFDNIDNDEDDIEKDLTAIFDDDYESDSEETEEYAEAVEENSGEVVEDESVVNEAVVNDEVEGEAAADENVDEDAADEDNGVSEDATDPREKSYHVIGMNETTNHYINKKKKKLAEKAAVKEAEKTEVNESEDSEDDTRELTPEEKELFGPYITSKDAKKQLINVIDNVSMASYTGNIILTGGDGTDVSDLATVIMKDIKQTDSNFSGKVARVPAKNLNNKKLEVVIKQLTNGALIIENASAMSDATAANLYKCLDQENLGIIITMLDSERNMEKLLSRAPRLSPLFTARMNVKPLTKEQLADYAVKYAYEREFSIDQMGMLALHRQIESRQTATHSVNTIEVKEIVDNAILHVKRKTLGHLFDILGGKRYDSEDMIILGEKDFI